MLKRIAITGPESTGKSWLSAALAARFSEPWVREQARDYLNRQQGIYDFDDILTIGQQQLREEERLATGAEEWLFCDTDFLVLRIWSLVKYGKSHPWIDAMVAEHPYHHYLLCKPDLPWEEDPLREHPHLREQLFGMYLRELEERGLPFSVVSGTGDARLMSALNALSPAGLFDEL